MQGLRHTGHELVSYTDPFSWGCLPRAAGVSTTLVIWLSFLTIWLFIQLTEESLRPLTHVSTIYRQGKSNILSCIILAQLRFFSFDFLYSEFARTSFLHNTYLSNLLNSNFKIFSAHFKKNAKLHVINQKN